MKNTKRIIALFYIILMLSFKVTGMHAFTHQNDDAHTQHCEVCDITTLASFTPLLEADSTSLPQLEYVPIERKLSSSAICIVYSNSFLESNPFTRPPPQLS